MAIEYVYYFTSQSLVQFLRDVLVEGILDSDVHQMQVFENESVFLKMPQYSFPPSPTVFLSAFTSLTSILGLSRANMPYGARA